MAEKYSFGIVDDFPNKKVDTNRLTKEIQESTITTALDYINSDGIVCDLWFKDVLTSDSSATLTVIISEHSGEHLPNGNAPTMPDGRPIVRSDSRPLDTETYFTMSGDSDNNIGDGGMLMWNFSDSTTDMYIGPQVPDGFKAKYISIHFHCPVNLKDGTIYFFDAPWGSYMSMYVGVPANSYYPNPAGSIPASALGLSGDDMYAYTTEKIPLQCYVNKHHMYGDCPMGDELNAEGAAINAIPVGWNVCGLIVTPESDNISKGFASLEMYRCHTMLLPGQTVANLHG